VVPLKYGVPWNKQNYGVNIAIYSQDGTVAISHGGIEVGQGINTKVMKCFDIKLLKNYTNFPPHIMNSTYFF
jgi:xanthine dehydrogenase molybdopterin-binding subunit B